MKNILLFALTLCSFFSNAQFNCNSWQNYDRVINFKAGAPFNASFDVGAQWSQFGAFIGVKSFVVTKQAKQYSEEDMPLIAYAKINATVISKGNFQMYAEAFGGKNYYGADIKIGLVVTDRLIIILVPEYSNQGKQAVDAGVSVTF